MAAHTPGPWIVEFRGYQCHPIYVRTEYRGCGGAKIHGSAGAIAKMPASKFHDQEANARLIASAPDLLAACRQMAEEMWQAAASEYTGADAYHEAILAGRQAIARAVQP